MKNQYPDLRTLLTRCKVSSPKFSLGLFGFLFSFSVLAAPCIYLHPSFGEVYVPLDEYVGYLDSNGIYTVVGNVKNTNDYAVIPTVTVSVAVGDSELFSKTIRHVPLGSGAEIPFKIKFPDIPDSPVLLLPELSFEPTTKDAVLIAVLYDETLIKHDDGHLTGRIQNTGDHTVYNPKIFAVIHGYDGVLDIGQNMEYIEKIEPGQILDFAMYPDPSITEKVFYYSCFGPVDTTVVPVTAKKDGGDFDFRYDSGAWYHDARFDEAGTTMSIRGYNSYPLETYANFEFPLISGNEKFSVTLNDEPVEFVQSIDEMGFWHVVFQMGPRSQGMLKISGFEEGLPPILPKIPQWIRASADWWATSQISDEKFLEGIDFLLEKQIVTASDRMVVSQSEWSIPSWVKDAAGWWYEEKISDDDFLNIIEYLIEQKVIVI